MYLLPVSMEIISQLLVKIWDWKAKSLHPQGKFPLLFFSVSKQQPVKETVKETVKESGKESGKKTGKESDEKNLVTF